jgi:hypothetical protein
MALTAETALDDLRQYVASRSFTMSRKLFDLFAWVERFSESVDNDPYPKLFLLALLRHAEEFRDVVVSLGGDPDAGANFIEDDFERDVEDHYGDSPLYSESRYREAERPELIDNAIRSAQFDNRTELRVRDLATALIRYELRLDKREGGEGSWIERSMRAPFLTLVHIADGFHEALNVRLIDLRKALNGLPRVLPKHVVDGVRHLLEDAPDIRLNGFVIMPFNAAWDDAYQAIIETLTAHGLRAFRADAKAYASDLLANIEVYLHGCGFAIAVYDAANSNVVYEAGYVRGLGKPVCILTPRGAAMHTDVAGLLRVDFDPENVNESIRAELSRWLIAQRIVDQEE